MEIIENLKRIDDKLDVALALVWTTKNLNVSTVIAGASHSSQITDNFGVLQ